MLKLPYFIYLDSKILGTAKQIVTFFDDDIFSRENTTILIKKYKHRSAKQLAYIFYKSGINYRFVNANDLDNLVQGVIFYPFNAQSNCRAVANRNLKHIFITHGESNKQASIKPIIRIYDYVITAGQAGIDRYLANQLFTPYDVQTRRIIPLGDTFIGRTGLNNQGKGENVIFYAPTWEGGIEKENYSSLAYVEKVSKLLIQLAEQKKLNKILIKPHPNTGHRDKRYITHLLDLIKNLIHKDKEVIIYRPYFYLTLLQRLRLKHQKIHFTNELNHFTAHNAFCDISAMETQFLNENILYYLFCSEQNKLNLQRQTYYDNAIILLNEENEVVLSPLSKNDFDNFKNYVIYQKYVKIENKNRINTLLSLLSK